MLGKDVGRSSSSGFSGLGDTFANFKGPSFFSLSEQKFSYPPPASPESHKAPVYVPQPGPAPAHKHPVYGPSHKCELKAEWFTPGQSQLRDLFIPEDIMAVIGWDFHVADACSHVP